jgi:hypothetical protein
MSKSFKKNRIVKDHTKGMEKLANHRVRAKLKSGDELPITGSLYKKCFVVMIFLITNLYVLVKL